MDDSQKDSAHEFVSRKSQRPNALSEARIRPQDQPVELTAHDEWLANELNAVISEVLSIEFPVIVSK